jgi:hypothetical protein
MNAKPEIHEDVPAGENTYEPPAIEQVLTGDNLDREVLYAGGQSGDQL